MVPFVPTFDSQVLIDVCSEVCNSFCQCVQQMAASNVNSRKAWHSICFRQVRVVCLANGGALLYGEDGMCASFELKSSGSCHVVDVVKMSRYSRAMSL
jgi:hypothetical protein